MKLYVARDECGSLWIHRGRPKLETNGCWVSDEFWQLEEREYPEVTFENSPMKSDNGRGDYLRHPTMLKARIKAHQKYLETHPNSKTMEYFGNSYNATFFQMFCNNLSEYRLKMSTDLWGGQLDAKKFLEEYFKIEL